jgi:hypothetical protein
MGTIAVRCHYLPRSDCSSQLIPVTLMVDDDDDDDDDDDVHIRSDARPGAFNDSSGRSVLSCCASY